MKSLVSTLFQRSTLMFTSFVLAVSSLSAAMPLFLSNTASAAGSAVELFADNFEKGFANWTSHGSQWSINISDSHSGSQSAIVNGPATDSDGVLVKDVSTDGYNNIKIEYSYKITDLAGTDKMGVEYGTNSSLGGVSVSSITDGGGDQNAWSSWNDKSVGLYDSYSSDSATFQIRFRAEQLSAGQAFKLDSVKLTGELIGNNAPAIGVTTPAGGETFPAVGTQIISADVTDVDDDIKSVKWFLSGTASTDSDYQETAGQGAFERQTGTDTWSQSYNTNLPEGSYDLKFVAKDSKGNEDIKTVSVDVAHSSLEIVKITPYLRSTSKRIYVDTTFKDYTDISKFKVELLRGGIPMAQIEATDHLLTGINTNSPSKITRTGSFQLPVNTRSSGSWEYDDYRFTSVNEPEQVRVTIVDNGISKSKIVNLTSGNLSNGGKTYQDLVPTSIAPVVDSITVNGQDITRANRNSTHPYMNGSTQRVDINIAPSNPDIMQGGYLMLNKLPATGNPGNGARTNYPIKHDTSNNSWYALVDTASLVDGKYLFKVEAHGNSAPWGYFGNTSAWYSHSYYVNVDNTIPAMQDIKLFVKNSSDNYVASSYVKAGDQARVEVKATDQASGIKNVEFRIQDASTGAYVAPRDFVATTVSADTYQYDFTVPADGKYTNTHGPITTSADGLKFWARAYDNVGNYGNGVSTNGLSGTFTYDNTAPVADITSPAADGSVMKDTIVITGEVDSAEANLKSHWFEITNPDGSKSYAYQMNATGLGYSFDLDTSKGDGLYTIRYVATDKAGNRSDASGSTIRTVVVDNADPVASITSSDAQSTATPTISGTVDGDAVDLEFTIDGSPQTLTWVPGETTWTFTPTTALTEGDHDITILATDPAGNTGGQAGTITIVLPEAETAGETGTTGGTTGTTPAATTPEATVTPGEVLGDQTTNEDAAANANNDDKTNPSASILGDATSNPMNLFGLAWYWWLLILAAIIAAWWAIAAALRRRDNQNA